MICKRTRPVLVLVERKSRFTIIARLKSKNAADTAKAIMDIFRQLDPDLRRSITFDLACPWLEQGAWNSQSMAS